MVRAHGRCPTSSFLLCSLFSDALGLPQANVFTYPAQGDPFTGYPIPVSKSQALHWGSRPRTPGGPRRRVAGTFNTVEPSGLTCTGSWCYAAALSGGGDAFAERGDAALESNQTIRGNLKQERTALGAT